MLYRIWSRYSWPTFAAINLVTLFLCKNPHSLRFVIPVFVSTTGALVWQHEHNPNSGLEMLNAVAFIVLFYVGVAWIS